MPSRFIAAIIIPALVADGLCQRDFQLVIEGILHRNYDEFVVCQFVNA
jgi:hypothetical protein